MCRILVLALCIGSVVLGPRLQAQLLVPTAPTAIPSGPTATATRVFHDAWLRITLPDAPQRSHDVPFAATIEAVIESSRGERVMWATRIAARADLPAVDAERQLRIPSLPSEVPFVLRISMRDRHGGSKTVYTQTSRLQFPDEAQVARAGVGAALQQAGFLGDFVIDLADGTVRRRDK